MVDQDGEMRVQSSDCETRSFLFFEARQYCKGAFMLFDYITKPAPNLDVSLSDHVQLQRHPDQNIREVLESVSH